ncbi:MULTISPECIES: hypothetical protein [Kitasatospora]|uniref:Transposase n=1 Tax=Kitasatospora cystarginea TaxID=58350 RepID=A0ABP5RYB4_9ACTN
MFLPGQDNSPTARDGDDLLELLVATKLLVATELLARAEWDTAKETVKHWRILRHARCSPNWHTSAAKAVLTVERQRRKYSVISASSADVDR